MKHFPFAALLGLLLSLCIASSRQALAQQLQFEILSFEVPGVAMLSGAADVNGDGQPDLLLFNKPAKESRDKFCTVYLQKGGTFPAKPDFEVHLGEQISGIQAVDLDSDGKDELIGFDGEGIMLFKLNSSQEISSRRIIAHRSLLPPTSRHLVPVNWLGDLTNDGKKDLLLPVVEGVRLFAQHEGFTFRDLKLFEFPLNGSLRLQGEQHYLSYRIPTIVLSDFDGDGRTDLGAFDLERMDYFLSNGSPSLDRHRSAPLLRKFTKDFIGASSFVDLNADHVPDAVLMLMSQKKNLESEVQIYFGAADFTYSEKPDQVYVGDSSLILPVFLDATGDGKLEMLLQDINVGFGFFMNYFLRSRIRVTTQLKKIGENGRYEEKAVRVRAIYVQASESGQEPARAAGDFNGDGLDDFVVGTAENRLSFFLVDPSDLLPAQPAAEFDVPAYGNMTLLDLNSDSRDDFVILYSDEGKENLAVVFCSK